MFFLRSCAFALLTLCVSSAARAQGNPTAVGVAYQLLDFQDLLFPIGLDLDVSTGLTRQFAVVGDVGWSRKSSQQFGLRDITTAFDVAGGLRWIARPDRRLAPFGQVLVGLERERTDIERFGADWTSSVLVQPGAGVVVRLTKRRDLFGEIDWRHVPQQSEHTNALRVLAGVRLKRSD